MPVSDQVRRLAAKWSAGGGWPKRLEWIEIDGLRGWEGQRFDFAFPITAVVGENGAGKSTVLQCAASVYKPEAGKGHFASTFFPDTPWDRVTNARIRYSVRERDHPHIATIRKPGERWRGNPERRMRKIEYIDLSRIQPVPARRGYSRMAKSSCKEVSFDPFEQHRLDRLSEILGRKYESAKMALSDADDKRTVPVLSKQTISYSGFHQGAGETTIVELLQADLPKYGLILIDEIESSLHPRAQRRLIRDLADRCREREIQVILTTHSPFVLEELPFEARAYIMQNEGRRSIVYGVSPEFAMTKMDEVPHYECDLYVEDKRAETMLVEILVVHARDQVQRCQIIRYGAASVGRALGEMIQDGRFPRASCVFIDGDQGDLPGCVTLPGEDSPERVVFNALRDRKWLKTAGRTGRRFADVSDACTRAMASGAHHDWVGAAASTLLLGGDTLWQTMCSEWAREILTVDNANSVVQAVNDALIRIGPEQHAVQPRLDL